MAIDYAQYKETIKAASVAARSATSIDAALEIQAAGYTAALAAAIAQAQVSTVVTTPNTTSGTGMGTVS